MTSLLGSPQRYLIVLIMCALLPACVARKQSDKLDVPEPSRANTYTNLGIQYMSRGQLDQALANFQRALDLDSGSSEAHHGIAILYEHLDQQNLAGEHLEKAVKLRPSNASAQTDYANHLCSRAEYARADQHFKIAISTPLYKSPWVAMANAGICALKAKKIDEAEVYLRQALDKRPNFAAALFAMARVSLEQDKPLSGRAFLQRYQSVADHTPKTLALGVEVEKELGDQRAADNYRALLSQKFPKSDEASAMSQ